MTPIRMWRVLFIECGKLCGNYLSNAHGICSQELYSPAVMYWCEVSCKRDQCFIHTKRCCSLSLFTFTIICIDVLF